MVDPLKVSTVTTVDGTGARYRLVGCPIPAPGAAQYLAGEPQPDRPTVFAGGLLGVVVGAFALVHLPPLHQCTGEGGQGIGADRTVAPVVDVFRCQCFVYFGGRDVESFVGIGQGLQQLGAFLF